MGFIIWYKVEFKEQQSAAALLAQVASVLPLGTTFPLKVSNDVFSGKYILDAEIVLTMLEGATVDKFKITLTNLPDDAAKALKDKQAAGMAKSTPQPLQVDIYLGYFDDLSAIKSTPVMSGVVTSIKTTVDQKGLLETLVEGEELAGYKLRTMSKPYDNKDDITIKKLVDNIAKDADVPVADAANLDPAAKLGNYTLKANNSLEALRQVATVAQVPLVIRDGKIFINQAVGNDETPVLDPDTNIVSQDHVDDTTGITDGNTPSKVTTSLELTVLGLPELRVGQKAKLKNPPVQNKTLRINQLVHRFSTNTGYTCEMTVVVADQGALTTGPTGVHGVVRRIRDLAESTQNQKPAFDVGQVTDYEPGSDQKHLATLNYGQSPPPGAIAPSVEVQVDTTTQLHSKPIVSPFAWHKCGLIVPIYSGMRALLAHNLGSVNDALVAGFLWSEEPTYERPKNEPGDYWLCLPTELGGNNQQPINKGVNDLTDKSGLRVIQAKGLHIFVGDHSLPEVGERPDVPDAQTIVIEHESGTTITIGSDGAISIQTDQKDISLSNNNATLKLGGDGAVSVQTEGKDISLSNNSVTLKLSGTSVEVK